MIKDWLTEYNPKNKDEAQSAQKTLTFHFCSLILVFL
jgi:hypothetical protein